MHLFFIIFFLVLPTLANVRPPDRPFFTINRVFVMDTAANAVLLGFFYLNYYLLIPKVYFKRQYALYIFYVVLFLFIAMTIAHFLGANLPENEPRSLRFGPQGPDGPVAGLPHHPSLITLVFDEFRRHLYLFFSAVFFSFLLRTREHLAELKDEKNTAELRLLKSQINPHFLFNTLNSIYVLSTKKDDRASSAIINLSGLMRYISKDAAGDRISLAKEIEYIGNYIDLQRARLGGTARIHFECTGDPEEKEIVPLLLITYIENAFKYGVNPEEKDSFVDVTIHIDNTHLRMQVVNRKSVPGNRTESTGIGIANTAERLQLLYPAKHHIDIRDESDTYSTTLSLELI